jgi:hypothetical protein
MNLRLQLWRVFKNNPTGQFTQVTQVASLVTAST